MNENVNKFLDFIGAAEGADYDTIVGGKQKITDFSRHPKLVGLRTAEGPSTAAGKYQITGTTYDRIAKKLGLTDFSPETQDRIAIELIRERGALEDVESGNWVEAIKKLGKEWASLPSSPYSQPKRGWDFVAKHLGISGKVADLPEYQFPSVSSDPIVPTQGPSQAEMTLTEARRQTKYGGLINQFGALPEAVSKGFENENAVLNFFREQGLSQYDPNFSWTEEKAQKALEGIPRDYWDYILQSGSDQEILLRRGRLKEAMERQKELGEMGVAGVLGSFTGALVDLPTLVGFVPVIGGMALISRTSRLANAIASGLASAGSNVAVDAAMLKYRPLGSTDELYFSATAGLGFGAIGGALADPAARAAITSGQAAARQLARAIDEGSDAYSRSLAPEFEALRQWGMREANRIYAQEIEDAGLKLTDRGRKLLLGEDGRLRVEPEVEGVRGEADAVSQFTRTVNLPRRFGAVADGDVAPKYPSGRPREAVSARQVLRELSEKAETEFIAPLASRLLQQIRDDVPIYEVPRSKIPSRYGGFYDPARHAIFVPKGASDWVKLHEIAHSLTYWKVEYGKANPDTVHGRLYQQLEEAFRLAQKEAESVKFSDSKSRYYLKDIHEFIAGLYSGKSEFTDFLSRIKVEDGNLLSKIMDTIRKLLGLEAKEANLFLKSLGLTDQIIDEPLGLTLRSREGVDIANVKLAPMDGVGVDPETVKAVTDAGLNDVLGWSFGLEHQLRKVKELPKAKALADKLIGTTVGYKNHAVVRRNAYDQALQLGDSWALQVRKVAYTQFNEFFKKSGRKFWERDDVAREWNAQLGDYVRGLPGEYDETVIKTGDQIRKALADVVDHINNPAKWNGGTKRGLTQDEYLDEAGNKLLTPPLEKNENYLPRAHDAHKWRQMHDQFGREFMEDFWAGAFRSANPDVDEEIAKRFGKWYVKRVEEGKIDRTGDFLSEQLRGLDKEALKESMVRSGMSEAEAQELLDAMFPKHHQGQRQAVSNLKKRSLIDESYSVDAQVGGEKVTITINDFINTDTLGVLDAYFRRMAGAIALANHADVYKQSDIARVIHEATQVDLGSNVQPHVLNKLRKDFQYVFDRLLHRPVEEWSPANKSLEMWRNFNVIRLMGAAVYNQVQELSQIIGTMGWKAFLRAVPQLGGLMRDLKSGKVKSPLLDDLENIVGGAGSDLIMRADFNPTDDWVRERGNTPFNRWLDKTDNAIRRAAAGTLKYTGMTGMMSLQKRIHAITFVNHFMDVATKGKKMGFTKERLAWMGLGDSDVGRILENMRKYRTEKTGVTGKKVDTVDFDKWAAEDPDSLSKFTTAFQRESRRVVQENDLASQIPVMSKAWAQTMFQFLNFVFHAWNKSLLFGLNHRDFASLSTVMHGMFFAGLVYIARTSAQSVGMSEEEKREFLEKRLNTAQVVRNAVGRIPQASVLPNFIDQVSPVPLFSGMRTTSDTSDFLTSNPTLSSINTLFSLWRKGVRNAFSDNYQFTERDMRSYIRLLPLNNVIGISGIYSSLVADFPKNEQVIPDRE